MSQSEVEYAANEAVYNMQLDTLQAIAFVQKNAGVSRSQAEKAVLNLVKPYVPVGELYRIRQEEVA